MNRTPMPPTPVRRFLMAMVHILVCATLVVGPVLPVNAVSTFSRTTTDSLVLMAPDEKLAVPFQRVTLKVEGQDLTASATLKMYIAKDKVLSLPFARTSSTITFCVPPVFKKSKFAAASVKVQLVESGAASAVESNMLPLKIGNLPRLTCQPGLVITSFLKAHRSMVQETQGKLAGTVLDVASIDTHLSDQVTAFSTLLSQFQALMNKDPKTLTKEEKKLDIPVLRETDRMIFGLLSAAGTYETGSLAQACKAWTEALTSGDAAAIAAAEKAYRTNWDSDFATIAARSRGQTEQDIVKEAGTVNLIATGLTVAGGGLALLGTGAKAGAAIVGVAAYGPTLVAVGTVLGVGAVSYYGVRAVYHHLTATDTRTRAAAAGYARATQGLLVGMALDKTIGAVGTVAGSGFKPAVKDTAAKVVEMGATFINTALDSGDLFDTCYLDITIVGDGAVAASPGRLLSDSGRLQYYRFTNIALTATPFGTATFSGWSGDTTGTGTLNFAITSDTAITATFASGTQSSYTLTIEFAGPGAGTVTASPGKSITTSSVLTYSAGTVVSLSAVPSSGSQFAAWTGAATGTGTASVTMSSNKAVTATFTTGTSTAYDGTYTGYASWMGAVEFSISGTIVKVVVPDTGTGTVSGSTINFSIPNIDYAKFTGTLTSTGASGTWNNSTRTGTWTAQKR